MSTAHQTWVTATMTATSRNQLEAAAAELRSHTRGAIRTSEPMSRHTTFRIGGPADVFVQPLDPEDLAQVVHFARTKGLPYVVIGNGSNLLVGDRGLRGLVIRLAPRFN
jgi:UDP-N-acetylmuramate dehydrogenase